MKVYGPLGLCRRFPFSLSLVAEINASDQRIFEKGFGTVGKSSDQRLNNNKQFGTVGMSSDQILKNCPGQCPSPVITDDKTSRVVFNDQRNKKSQGRCTMTALLKGCREYSCSESLRLPDGAMKDPKF